MHIMARQRAVLARRSREEKVKLLRAGRSAISGSFHYSYRRRRRGMEIKAISHDSHCDKRSVSIRLPPAESRSARRRIKPQLVVTLMNLSFSLGKASFAENMPKCARTRPTRHPSINVRSSLHNTNTNLEFSLNEIDIKDNFRELFPTVLFRFFCG